MSKMILPKESVHKSTTSVNWLKNKDILGVPQRRVYLCTIQRVIFCAPHGG